MNTRIKHTAIGALLLCVGVAGMQGVTARESKQEARQAVTLDKRNVGAFHAIELAGPFRVIVTEGAPRLELSGEAKQLADIETEVRNGTLVVRQRRSQSGFSFHFGKQDKVERPVVRIGASNCRASRSSWPRSKAKCAAAR